MHFTRKTRFLPRLIWCAIKLCPIGCKACDCRKCGEAEGFSADASLWDRNLAAYAIYSARA